MNTEINAKCNEVRNEIIRRLRELGHEVSDIGGNVDGEQISWSVRIWGRTENFSNRRVPEVHVGIGGYYRKRMKKDGTLPYDEIVEQILMCVESSKQSKINDNERAISKRRVETCLAEVGIVKDEWNRYDLPGQFTKMSVGSDGSIQIELGFTKDQTDRAIAFIELIKTFAEQDAIQPDKVA